MSRYSLNIMGIPRYTNSKDEVIEILLRMVNNTGVTVTLIDRGMSE